MPRKGYGSKVGGARTGSPGTAYSNRSDLNGAQPAQAAPGQTYGQAGDQLEAQGVVPLPQVSPTGGATGQPPPLPGDLTPLDAPSLAADEPITTGLSSGAGAGPEVLWSSPRNAGTTALEDLAMHTNDPFLVALAERAQDMR